MLMKHPLNHNVSGWIPSWNGRHWWHRKGEERRHMGLKGEIVDGRRREGGRARKGLTQCPLAFLIQVSRCIIRSGVFTACLYLFSSRLWIMEVPCQRKWRHNQLRRFSSPVVQEVLLTLSKIKKKVLLSVYRVMFFICFFIYRCGSSSIKAFYVKPPCFYSSCRQGHWCFLSVLVAAKCTKNMLCKQTSLNITRCKYRTKEQKYYHRNVLQGPVSRI